jgi:uncharacterized membrane protein
VKVFESLAFLCFLLSSRKEKFCRKVAMISILHSPSLQFWLISFMVCHLPSFSISRMLSIRLCNWWHLNTIRLCGFK